MPVALSQPLAKKRGWVLPSAEPSVSAAADSTTGYFDTPSKYRDMAENMDQEDLDDMVAGEPPSFSALAIRGNVSVRDYTFRGARYFSLFRTSPKVNSVGRFDG